MKIEAKNLSKRFNREKIFTNFSYEFTQGNKYAITGPNGSGKSTLLRILAGNTLPSTGEVTYASENHLIEPEEIYKYLSIATPYMELIEEFTLLEQVDFHYKYKKLKVGETFSSIVKKSYFNGHEHKLIKNFSSGMKQRLKLMLALFSDTPILFLDEPTSNLDTTGITWFLSFLNTPSDRLILLASNQELEYKNCNYFINLEEIKSN